MPDIYTQDFIITFLLHAQKIKSFIVNNLQGYGHLVKTKTFYLLKIIPVQRHLIVCVREREREPD